MTVFSSSRNPTHHTMKMHSTIRNLALALLTATGALQSHASKLAYSTYLTFSVDMSTNILNSTFTNGVDTVSVHGTFDGWGSGVQLVEEGTGNIYTNTVNDTTDANGNHAEYKFVINGVNYESVVDGNNRAVMLPASYGSSVILPTAFFADAGAPVTNQVFFQVDMSQQVVLGSFAPASDTVEVQGSFEGWTSGQTLTYDPHVITTNQFGLTATNVYDGFLSVTTSPGAMVQYKYVIQPTGKYESPSAANAVGYTVGNNRFFANSPGLVLPNVFFSDAPFAPLSAVTLSVDMSAQLFYGNWTPSDGVFCQGINGDWNNDAVNTMTNVPGAANTNVYYVTYTLGEGSSNPYKFTYNGATGTVYESPTSTGGNNRVLTVPSQNPYSAPTLFFSDLLIDDLLESNVQVTFFVNMSNAVQYGTSTAFNPATDNVYVNGTFGGSWLSWDPISLNNNILTNTQPANPNNYIYSGTFPANAGQALGVTYKYSINGSDNEAASGNNHYRLVRSLANGSYVFPVDTFGNQYGEPSFGELKASAGSSGSVQLSWLGAPNVKVQTRNSLSGTGWTTLAGTSGVTWSAGTNSPNGLVSVTNWPAASGSTYFRLVQH